MRGTARIPAPQLEHSGLYWQYIQGSSRTGTHGNAVSVLFLYNGNVVPVVFFCIIQFLTVLFHGSPSVIKLIRLCTYMSTMSIVGL